MNTNRRSFMTGAAAVSAAAAAQAVAQAPALPNVRWRMTSSFPKSLDTIYGGAEVLAKRWMRSPAAGSRSRCSRRARSCPRSKPPTRCRTCTVEAAHTASYYFVGKNKTFAFDTTLPSA
jgi:TRAP-type mannitol/chloroaromatic compound transport system substrate-binding protein